MKKLLLLSLIGVSIVACKKEPVKDYLIFSGKVDNFKKRSFLLKGFDFVKKISVNKKDGTFSDTLQVKDGFYKLRLNKSEALDLYLTKTEDTKLLFDFKKLSDIKYEGPNTIINNYFVKKNKIYAEIIINAYKLFPLEETLFLDTLEQYKETVNELAITSKLSPDFLKKEIKNINYEYLRNLYNYESYHRQLTGNNDFIVSENFPSALENFSFNNGKDYVNSISYKLMVNEEIDKINSKNIDENSEENVQYLKTVNDKVNDSLIKNDLLFIKSKKSIFYTTELKLLYDQFIKYSTNDKHKKEITKTYNSLKRVARGQPAPKFENYENYNGGTTSLDDLLGNGKYIYIDVWATWCSYCKREIPLLKRLEEEYHGKNIEFVSISVDKKNFHEKWKETIVQREMTGVQLFSGSEYTKLKWAQDFLVKGLPKFILIDPNGNIVTSNAPRPSAGSKLIDIFDELGI